MRVVQVAGALVGCGIGAVALALMGLGLLPIAVLAGLVAAGGIGMPALLARRER